MEQVGDFSEQKLLLQAVFERSFEAIVIIDRALRFVEVNPSACELFGSTKEQLIGQSLADFFTSPLNLEGQDITRVKIRHSQDIIKTVEYSEVKNLFSEYNLLVFRDVTNLQRAAEAELHRQHQRVKLFSDVTLKIRQSLQLKEILHTAVTEVQRILQADRVLIYQVFANGTGMPISEAVLPDYDPILGVEFPEEVFPEEYREMYAGGRVQAIANVHDADTGLAECLVEFMDEWMVKAKLIVPILQNLKSPTDEHQSPDRLWGLLIAHQCATPRQWTNFELELMEQLADQIGIALSQGELLENLEDLVEERTTKLREVNRNLQQEIKDRLDAEAALRRSEEQLRLIANGLPVLIAYVDKHQRYRFNNEVYQTWLGLSPSKIHNCHLEKVHGEEEYQQIREYVGKALSGKTVTYETDIVLLDGCMHSLSVTYIPHFNERKKNVVRGFFALTSDISDRKAIERMKDEFISVVSHELRTPLTSIHSSLKILATGKLGNLSSKGQRMLKIADEQTERLVRLVNNVLDLQSIQSGKAKMNKTACNATDLMIEAAQTMQTMAQERGVKLFAESVNFLVWADRDYIVQTLTNLLSNAIKFSPPDSTVWLSAKRKRQRRTTVSKKSIPYITFEVKDQGQGIPTNQLESIFERFQQVDSSDSRKKGGTGLGLAICRQIIEEHDGKIWAESCVGKGSTFYFTLPAVI
ncbi:MAG: ATP-binding protein [Xenococcaceae cyanobacterium MO_188.B29]|nr:ATP-binding protein [Xenococcaceae cyanobacterium MO_188.B29]